MPPPFGNEVTGAYPELQPIAAGTAGDNGYGTFQVNADGTWTYTLDNSNPAVQALTAEWIGRQYFKG